MQQTFFVLETAHHFRRLIRASKDYEHQPHRVILSRPIKETRTVTIGNKEYHQTVSTDEDYVTEVEPFQVLTPYKTAMVLRCLVDEAVSQLTRYQVRKEQITPIARILFNTPAPTEAEKIVTENFIQHVDVDETNIDLYNELIDFVGIEPWREWEVHQHGAMIALIGGQDYRISYYESQFGTEDDGDEIGVRIDISAVASHIHQRMVTHYGAEVVNVIPIAKLVADGITRQWPLVSFPGTMPAPTQFLHSIGADYETLYRKVASEALEVLAMTGLVTKIQPGRAYIAEITANYTLVLYSTEQDRDVEDQYYRHLRECMDRGDHIPERERRELEDYERTIR